MNVNETAGPGSVVCPPFVMTASNAGKSVLARASEKATTTPLVETPLPFELVRRAMAVRPVPDGWIAWERQLDDSGLAGISALIGGPVDTGFLLVGKYRPRTARTATPSSRFPLTDGEYVSVGIPPDVVRSPARDWRGACMYPVRTCDRESAVIADQALLDLVDVPFDEVKEIVQTADGGFAVLGLRQNRSSQGGVFTQPAHGRADRPRRYFCGTAALSASVFSRASKKRRSQSSVMTTRKTSCEYAALPAR